MKPEKASKRGVPPPPAKAPLPGSASVIDPEPDQATTIEEAKLDFDRANPRLAEFGVGPKTSDEEILAILWEEMDVRELVQSIAASGFFPHEVLIVAKEGGKNVVIEGNRRLAAVRVLLHPGLIGEDAGEIPAITPEATAALNRLPIRYGTREASWQYLGFKHVNGPAKWSGYAKAKYIALVHRQYGVSLEGIATQIGDGHRTVQRLYRGLMVIEQAERKKVFDRENRYRQRLAFSHLYTGLDYEGINSFLQLKVASEESKDPVPDSRLKELGEFCSWLYGDKREGKPPVVESQNPDLRKLDEVLKSREATGALRETRDLERAYEISRPKTIVFEEALLAAKRSLTTARAHLTEGYDRSEALLRIAGTIADTADDVYSEMERKHSGSSKKKRMKE